MVVRIEVLLLEQSKRKVVHLVIGVSKVLELFHTYISDQHEAVLVKMVLKPI